VIGLRVAGGHFVERVERADTLAGGEVLNVDAAFGQLGDARCQALQPKPRPGKSRGQVDTMTMSMVDCAIAGVARLVAAAAPVAIPADLINLRRSIVYSRLC
jgi:hypothetical protein